ncbi:MAG: hypothetical protein ACJ0BB_03260 [Dehalococcoidia bacterium]
MGSSISALLIISVLLTSVVVMFRSNQIGMNFLAEANRAAAEYRSEKLESAFDLNAGISTLQSFNSVDAQGCKPLYSGINREGQISPASTFQCYWFDAPAGTNFSIDFERGYLSPMNRTTPVRLSFDYFNVGTNVTPTNEGDGGFEDETTRTGTVNFSTTTTSDANNKHHLKIWSFGANSTSHYGKYSIKLNLGDAVNLSTIQCVEEFRLENISAATFPVGSVYFLDKIDVFVQLRPENGGEIFTKLSRSDSATLGNDEWFLNLSKTINIEGVEKPNDTYEPSIFNTNEILEISIKLNNYNQESGSFILVWPNGLKTTENFDSLCNN